MKRVLIQDDDAGLFNIPLQPSLYNLYKENSKEIRRMIKQQGVGFWIQFVTSFRSFISNSFLDRTGGHENYEEAFIDMLKILTMENCFMEFVSLIESLKTLHVLLGSQCGQFLWDAQVMILQGMSGFNKPLHTFPVYSRFVGAVVVLYTHWKHAPRIKARTPPVKWTPPAHWIQQNGHGPHPYECYLYDRWGNVLYRMIRVDKEVMKFFNAQMGGDSTNTSSSKNQNNMSDMCTTQQRKNRKRRSRNRNRNKNKNKNKNGGVCSPKSTLNETAPQNENDSPCAKGDGSSVIDSIAGDSHKAQSGNVGQKKQKRETDTSVGTSNKTESSGRFRYDRLFKFSNREVNGESDRNNIEVCGEESDMPFSAAGEARGIADITRKDATFRYDKLFSFSEKGHDVSGCSDIKSAAKNEKKEKVQPSAETELATDTGATSGLSDDHFFLIGKSKCTDEDTSKWSENTGLSSDVKTKEMKDTVPHPEDKEPTSCHSKTADFFRYDRLFTSSKKIKKGTLDHPADKWFTTNRDTAKKTDEKNFFRYDRLFNFNTGKQNTPENTDNRATTNKTEEKDFFRYDRVFSCSTQKQNVTDNTDESSVSSDDSYQYESEYESEGLDDYTPFHEFLGGRFGGPFSHTTQERNVSQPVRKYLMQKCSNCNILEKYPGMYKACKRCLAEGVQAPKLYCGEHCGRIHWRKQHRADHRTE